MTLFLLFGATGHLARSKLIPALYRCMLSTGDRLTVLGTGRSDWDDAAFRTHAVQALKESGVAPEAAEAWCGECLVYQRLEETHRIEPALARARALEQRRALSGDRIYYLAVPPHVFEPLIEALGRAPRGDEPGWTRLVIEKPFGDSLESARRLNRLLHRYFDESEIYRIDHYLGKDTVQNLLVFRFANAIFEAVWDRTQIERVEITVAEKGGAEGRARYYDRAGALRDMVQNHLTQLLALAAMEAPARFDAHGIRSEKVKVLQSILPIDPENVVLGQYTGSEWGEGYREHAGVPADSTTETFAAVRLWVQNWRWQGVPFCLRTGKRLPKHLTEIAVYFRCPPVHLFGGPNACAITRNVLRIRIQPEEGFELGFEVKEPSAGSEEGIRLTQQQLRFDYAAAFGRIPDAYETLLSDLLSGDQTLFVHAEEAEAAWELYQPLLDAALPVHPYPSGAWGPEAAARMFVSDPRNPVTGYRSAELRRVPGP